MKKRIIALIVTLSVLLSVFAFGMLHTSALVGATYIKGDVNGDGKVDINDCVCICLIKEKKMDYVKRADINFDKTVDEEDAEILAKYIARLIDSLPEDSGDIELPIFDA